MPRALITGIGGQDGAYLTQLLLEKGYEVFGLLRRGSSADAVAEGLDWLGLRHRVPLLAGDLTDFASLLSIVEAVDPQEIYNLAADSFVPRSWEAPLRTSSVTAIGAHNLLEVMRRAASRVRLYQASSSEMFGHAETSPQTEMTPFRPGNPYAVSKLYAHWTVVNYRQRFGLHVSSGIMFNHESVLRGLNFVTRKITDGVAQIKLGLASELAMGNLDATRDWGHSRDYVRAMWLMLQQSNPDDYVVATGRALTVREICRLAFAHAGLDYTEHVRTDPRFLRPIEAVALVGNATKARAQLGWTPTISVEEMLAEMVEADIARHRGRVAGRRRTL
jgi:GDPmannose 4,6-dehydratase